jgi:hypothetical protein
MRGCIKPGASPELAPDAAAPVNELVWNLSVKTRLPGMPHHLRVSFCCVSRRRNDAIWQRKQRGDDDARSRFGFAAIAVSVKMLWVRYNGTPACAILLGSAVSG